MCFFFQINASYVSLGIPIDFTFNLQAALVEAHEDKDDSDDAGRAEDGTVDKAEAALTDLEHGSL
jgi:hypothetical protein